MPGSPNRAAPSRNGGLNPAVPWAQQDFRKDGETQQVESGLAIPASARALGISAERSRLLARAVAAPTMALATIVVASLWVGAIILGYLAPLWL